MVTVRMCSGVLDRHLSHAVWAWALRATQLIQAGTSPTVARFPGLTMRSGESGTVIIFVKYPKPGAVKTRLAADVGPVAATQLYKACAEHTVRAACR